MGLKHCLWLFAEQISVCLVCGLGRSLEASTHDRKVARGLSKAGWAVLWKLQPMTAWSLVVEQTLSPPVRFRGACRTGGVHAPCRFGSTEDITEERMTTSGSWMPQLLVLSPRSGGPFKEATGRIQKRQPTTARPVPWANSGRFRRGFVPITCLAVLDLGLPEGRSLGPTLGGREGPWAWLITSSLCWSRVHAPGLVLSLGAKVDSKQTPSQGKASSDRFDPGSFFSPLLLEGWSGRRQRCCTTTHWRRFGRCPASASREETGTLA